VPDLARAVRGDRDPLVRDMAGCALGEVVLTMKHFAPTAQWEQSGKTLEEALLDKDHRVRRSAAFALGAFGSTASPAASALKKALRDSSPAVRQNAAWALGRLGPAADGATVTNLCEVLSDDNALVRRDGAAALGNLGKDGRRSDLKAAGKPLLEMVKKEKNEVARKTALGALATLSGPAHAEFAPDLYPLLESKDAETSRGAAYVLANMGGEPARRAVNVMRVALADPDTDVQALAAAALANAGAEAAPAVDDLARVLTDSRDPVVRRNCAIALGHVGAPAKTAVPALAAALKPPTDSGADAARTRANEEVREMAAEAIAQIRFPQNESAFPAVRDVIARDANQIVRHRCIWALFNFRDLDRYDLTRTLTAVLDEKAEETRPVRYDAARVLAYALSEKVPDKVCDVLVQMISDDKLKAFKGTDATITGAPDESRGGASGTAQVLGGDARWMAAEAMGWLGDKARNNKAVVNALRTAVTDREPKLKEKAARALKELGLPEK
jgi:HEAT repeat protein